MRTGAAALCVHDQEKMQSTESNLLPEPPGSADGDQGSLGGEEKGVSFPALGGVCRGRVAGRAGSG